MPAFDFGGARATTGMGATTRPTTTAPGPQQVAGNYIATPWAVNGPAMAPINFSSPNYNLYGGQQGMLQQQQALAAQLRAQGAQQVQQRAQDKAAAAAALKARQEQQNASTALQDAGYYSNGEPISGNGPALQPVGRFPDGSPMYDLSALPQQQRRYSGGYDE